MIRGFAGLDFEPSVASCGPYRYRRQRWRRHSSGACADLCPKRGRGTGCEAGQRRARRCAGIEVVAPYDKKTSDDEIAKRGANILKWNMLIPNEAVQTTVNGGWIIFNGDVNGNIRRPHQKAAIFFVTTIFGGASMTVV